MKVYMLVITSCLLISGCDQGKVVMDKTIAEVYRTNNTQPPIIAISAGWQIDDHGKLGDVYGYSECPKSLLSITTESSCIIIGPTDIAVSVLISIDDMHNKTAKREVWTIERQGEFPNDSLRLKRPDNSYVKAWGKNNS